MTMTTYDEIYPDGFNGYPTFDEVRNPVLRAWNRLNTFFNMKEFLKNSEMGREYMKQFNHQDQVAIAMLASKVSKDGYENTRREIMRVNNVR
jgi:hypothetical protein